MLDRYGPCIVNDISAGGADAAMLPLVAAAGVPYIAMHMRGTPTSMHDMTMGEDVGGEVLRYFERKLETFDKLGITRVVIDPGFGFSKDLRQNHELLRALPRLAALERPLLVGVSRKSMIWKVTGGTPQTALAGTCALHWQALLSGATILRAHDVQQAVDVIKLFKYYDDTGKGHS
ncbi:MAG: dihydropteroate synthase, partial [Rikenellaceae bacterium]|jgi:dihydropteroate synthase|nr:dihydropteroate synthase [Rikenellaceae bacterium]